MSESRLLVVTGKGGAGTTTVAAATTLAAAARGLRAVVAGLGEPGALARVLGVDLSVEPMSLEGLPQGEAWVWDCGGELNAGREIEGFLAALGLEQLAPEEAMALPGFACLPALVRLAELAASDEYDLVVLDAGAMAEGLRMLGWIDLLAAASRSEREASVPASAPTPHGLERLAQLAMALANPGRASARLVMTGEPLAVESALQAAARLSVLGVGLGAVIVNRQFVQSVSSGYLGAWAGTQSRVLSQARESFGDVPILPCWLQPEEVVGVPAVLRLAEDLYAGRDPLGEVAAAADRAGGRSTAAPDLALPFVDPATAAVFARDEGIAIVAHRFRRAFAWQDGRPADLRATWRDGRLRFE